MVCKARALLCCVCLAGSARPASCSQSRDAVHAQYVAASIPSSHKEWTSVSMHMPSLLPPLPYYRRHNRAGK